MNSLKSGSSLIRVPAMMRSNKFRHDGDTVCSAIETSRTSPTTVMQGASFYHHFHASHDHRIAVEVAVHVKTCNAGPCGAFRRMSGLPAVRTTRFGHHPRFVDDHVYPDVVDEVLRQEGGSIACSRRRSCRRTRAVVPRRPRYCRRCTCADVHERLRACTRKARIRRRPVASTVRRSTEACRARPLVSP